MSTPTARHRSSGCEVRAARPPTKPPALRELRRRRQRWPFAPNVTITRVREGPRRGGAGRANGAAGLTAVLGRGQRAGRAPGAGTGRPNPGHRHSSDTARSEPRPYAQREIGQRRRGRVCSCRPVGLAHSPSFPCSVLTEVRKVLPRAAA